MIRMKNRINQVVVDSDYQNPKEYEITNVYRKGSDEFGKVLLDGKKHRVKCIGGGVWVLVSSTQVQEVAA